MFTPWPGWSRPSTPCSAWPTLFRRGCPEQVRARGKGLGELLVQLARVSPLLALAGCAGPGVEPAPAPLAQAYTCILPSEQRMLVAELFFARSVKGRGPVREAEWAQFARDVVTANFPDGFTVFDGDGQWQNPATHEIGRQRTKILLIAAPRSPDLALRLAAVIDAYKMRFRQQSVGIITRDSCANFN
jgi:hypothetical protein